MALLPATPQTERKPITLIYGAGGLGKDTFAAGFPKPLPIDIEDGMALVKTPEGNRLPNIEVRSTWDSVMERLEALAATPDPSYETLILSGIDMLEGSLHKKLVAEDSKGAKSMVTAYGGYANAFTVADEMWAQLFVPLRKIRAQGKYINVVCHEKVYSYNDPTVASYDRYRLKLYEGSKASAAKLWFDFADIVLFAKRKVYQAGENRALDDNKTYIYTQGRAAFDAKSRYDLQPEMELNATKFLEALYAKPKDAKDVYAEIVEMANALKTPADKAKVLEVVERYKNNVNDLNGLKEQVKTLARG